MQKKLLTVLLLISFSFVALTPRVSYALPVADPVTNAQEIMSMIKEYGLDSLAYSLSKLAGTKLANKVFNKANGGASKDSHQPSYISNFTSYFSDLQMGQVDKFVTDLGASRNPFATDIAQSLIKNVQNNSSDLEGFNLDQVVGNNWKDFSNDATVGGWAGMLALSNPANTNIGSALIAKQELANKIQTATEVEKIKLTAPGTKPQGQCNLDFGQYRKNVESNNASADAQNMNMASANGNAPRAIGSNPSANGSNTNSNPRAMGNNPSANGSNTNNTNSNANQALANQTNNSNQNANNANQALANQSNASSSNQASQNNYLQNNSTDGTNPVSGLLDTYGGCLDELIQNPLGLVTGTLNKALDSVSDQASQGDEIGEILVGMLINMMTSFLKGGLSSLSADFQQNRAPIGGPEQLVAKNGQPIPWTKTPDVIVDMPATFQQSITSTEGEVKLLNEYVRTLSEETDANGNRISTGESLASALTRLDQCIPGPDYRYDKKIDPYVTLKTAKLERRKDKGGDGKKQTKNDLLDNIKASLVVAKSDMELALNSPDRNIPGASIMHGPVDQLRTIRDTYKQKKTSLVSKQATLGLLYKIESDLKANISMLNPAAPDVKFIPTLPSNIPFTDAGWNNLSSAEQASLVAWVKTEKKLPQNAPFTAAAWNNLTATQKTALVTWAKTIDDQKTGVTDKDFVLSTVFLYTGLDPATPEADMNRDFAISVIWDVWTNPEVYIDSTALDAWNNGKADTFMKAKNAIRAEYNSLQNDVSIPYSMDQAKTSLVALKNTIQTAKDMADDCTTMRTIISTNRFTGPDAHKQIMTVLKNSKSKFKSDAVYQSITGTSIISNPPGYYYDQNCPDDPAKCRQDVGLVEGDGESDNPLLDMLQRYQVPPAHDVWELIDQGDNALCGLNQYVGVYPARQPNPTLDGGKPIECSNDWNHVKKSDIVGYLFGDSVD